LILLDNVAGVLMFRELEHVCAWDRRSSFPVGL
jgi:hypothetical protein